jgi:hypothetical protein
MAITRYYTEAEAIAAVIADGGDPSCNVRWFSNAPQWEARTGSDRNYPPEIYKVSREITAQLTPEEKAGIFAAALANAGIDRWPVRRLDPRLVRCRLFHVRSDAGH